MPQKDRHKNRTVYIEFAANENFGNLPYKERFTIIFITSGSLKLNLNDYPVKVTAPSILCLSMDDKIQVLERNNVSSQSFFSILTFLIRLIFQKLRAICQPV